MPSLALLAWFLFAQTEVITPPDSASPCSVSFVYDAAAGGVCRSRIVWQGIKEPISCAPVTVDPDTKLQSVVCTYTPVK